MVAYAYWKRIINIPFTDPGFSAIDVKLVNPEKIDISVDSSEFHEGWQGNVTLRFNTPKAPGFYNKLMDMMSD